MKITHRIFSQILVICMALMSFSVPSAFADGYPEEGIVWDFNSADAVSAANSAVATAACGKITADYDFVNLYGVSASFTTNATRRMQIKLPNNVIQQKNEDGEYVYNYLHILVGNPQDTEVTFGCGINTTSVNTQVTLPANSWTVASFYIEDLFLAGNSNYKRDGKNYADSVEGVAFQMSDQVAGANTTNAGIKYNLDKVWVTAEPLPAFELESVSPYSGYEYLSPLDATIKFDFKRNLKPADACILPDAFKSADGTGVDAELKVSGKSLFVKAKETLSFDTQYSLDFSGSTIKDCYGIVYPQELSYSFATLNGTLASGTLSAEDENGNEVYCLSDGSVNISAKAINVSADAETAIIAAVAVNGESGEAELFVSSSSELPGEMSEPCTLENITINADNGTDIYAVVVNNLSDMNPLVPAFLSLGTNRGGMVYTGCDADGEIVLDEPAISVDTLTISGKYAANCLVLVSIRSITDNELIFLMPLVTGDDGAFSTDYVFANASSGKYEISALTYGNPSASKCEVVYLGEETKEEIRKAFDEDITSNSAFDLLNKYRDGMGIPSAYTEDKMMHIASVLCEQKPYSDYAELISVMNKASEALDELNASSWSSYASCFEKYSFILNDDDSLSDYFEYDERGRAEIHKIAAEKSPFKNFADLRTALSDAEKSYAKKLEENKKPSSSSRPSGGGSGGGGFGGGGVSISPAGTGLKESASAPVADTVSGNAEFTDVTSAHWAYNALNELAKRNIVSGYADGTFGGENNVSRAEFVKILTGVFSFAEGKGEKFSDVTTGVWYEEFLNRASLAGIVKGNDGKFMPDEAITRQDAALMLYRSIQYKNLELNGSKDFADMPSISSYAAEAVSKMGASGLLAGYEDGSFMPQKSITRFEAVQLMYNAMKYISGGAK